MFVADQQKSASTVFPMTVSAIPRSRAITRSLQPPLKHFLRASLSADRLIVFTQIDLRRERATDEHALFHRRHKPMVGVSTHIGAADASTLHRQHDVGIAFVTAHRDASSSTRK